MVEAGCTFVDTSDDYSAHLSNNVEAEVLAVGMTTTETPIQTISVYTFKEK